MGYNYSMVSHRKLANYLFKLRMYKIYITNSLSLKFDVNYVYLFLITNIRWTNPKLTCNFFLRNTFKFIRETILALVRVGQVGSATTIPAKA